MTAADPNPADPRLQVELAGLTFRNPLLTASGTCGYGSEYADVIDYRKLGGFTTKSVTREVRPGNDPQRIVEVRGGLLNAIGLANVGIDAFESDKVPVLREMHTTILVNVAGHSLEDYVHVCGRLDGYDCIPAIELNVSCPNVADGLTFGTDAKLLGELVAAVRNVLKATKLCVKLTPNVTDITALARAAIDNGADLLSLINTYVGMAIDIDRRRPMLANTTGGLSGPAIKPLALFAIHRVYREVAQPAGIPLIGMGGVQTTRDAIEFMLAGADAVAVGTALFVDPTIPIKISDGLSAYCDAHQLGHISELVGQLQV